VWGLLFGSPVWGPCRGSPGIGPVEMVPGGGTMGESPGDPQNGVWWSRALAVETLEWAPR
jgi:hypothetical protein